VAFAPLTRGGSDKGKGPADMTVYPPVSVFLGDCGEGQLELDGGELAEGSLASPAVVGVLDPHEDRVGELGSRGPALAVQDVLLEQRVEGLHGGVVAGRGDPAHRPGEVVRLEHRHEGLLCSGSSSTGADPVRVGAGSMAGEADRVRPDREGAPLTRWLRAGQCCAEEDGCAATGLPVVRAILICRSLRMWPGVRRPGPPQGRRPALTLGQRRRSAALISIWINSAVNSNRAPQVARLPTRHR
jgi:hypothetical protein